VGYNYRMTNIQAAIGVGQMERVGQALARRQEIAAWYHEEFAPLTDRVELPTEAAWAGHVYWMFNIFLRDADEKRRDAVMRSMDAAGVETRPVFYPMHVLPPYREETSYPVADSWACRGINLPTHEGLDRADVRRVVQSLGEALEATARDAGTRRKAA
jgi:perosamine synthetase